MWHGQSEGVKKRQTPCARSLYLFNREGKNIEERQEPQSVLGMVDLTDISNRLYGVVTMIQASMGTLAVFELGKLYRDIKEAEEAALEAG